MSDELSDDFISPEVSSGANSIALLRNELAEYNSSLPSLDKINFDHLLTLLLDAIREMYELDGTNFSIPGMRYPIDLSNFNEATYELEKVVSILLSLIEQVHPDYKTHAESVIDEVRNECFRLQVKQD